jgi:hypothetical protein
MLLHILQYHIHILHIDYVHIYSIRIQYVICMYVCMYVHNDVGDTDTFFILFR